MKKEHSSIVVKRSTAGLGLFANTEFKKGDFIIAYTGEHISHEEADRREGKYLFTLSKDVVIDGKGRDNLARYINHSCTPNAEVEANEETGTLRVTAKKTILQGDEITYNYGKDYFLEYIYPNGCRCRTCRK